MLPSACPLPHFHPPQTILCSYIPFSMLYTTYLLIHSPGPPLHSALPHHILCSYTPSFALHALVSTSPAALTTVASPGFSILLSSDSVLHCASYLCCASQCVYCIPGILYSSYTARCSHSTGFFLHIIFYTLCAVYSALSTLCPDVTYFALHSPLSIPQTLLTMLSIYFPFFSPHSFSSSLILHTLYCIPHAPFTRFSTRHHLLTHALAPQSMLHSTSCSLHTPCLTHHGLFRCPFSSLHALNPTLQSSFCILFSMSRAVRISYGPRSLLSSLHVLFPYSNLHAL